MTDSIPKLKSQTRTGREEVFEKTFEKYNDFSVLPRSREEFYEKFVVQGYPWISISAEDRAVAGGKKPYLLDRVLPEGR